MKKWRIFLSLDREEAWINQVQDKGYRLSKVNFYTNTYTFEPLTGLEEFKPYTRLDYRGKTMSLAKQDEYRTFFEDSGWKLIAGRSSGLQYFQQIRPGVTRDIFSDNESKQAMRQRYTKYALWNGLFFLLLLMINMSINEDFKNILNGHSWFITPGIWQRQGWAFWSAFLFELPFAIFRKAPIILYFCFIVHRLLVVVMNRPSKEVSAKTKFN